jgi:phosphatidylinositol alpha-mannosyltransferase
MRIGIVCPYAWDVPGGVQVHVRDLAEEFTRLGHWVSVLAPAEDEDALPDYVVSAGRPVAVPYNGSVAMINFGPRPLSRAREWIRDSDFDVMHVHEPVQPGLSVLAIWAARGPIVATWHSSYERSRAMNAMFPIAQTVMEKVSGRIAVSELARRTLVDHLGGDAVLIPNGVNCRNYAATTRLPGWPGEGGALMFLGRIDEPRKGLQVLLAALPAIIAEHPGVRLVVVGPGDVEGMREELNDDLRQRITFLGLAPEAEKIAAYHSVDLYIAPNTGGESFGIVLLEAMASRTPVLASDLESFSRVLDRGRAGVLFRNEDPADLAAKANALLADAGRRRELAEAGYQRAWLFDWSRVAAEVLDVYSLVTSTGEKVTNDLRGQFVGRWARRSGWSIGGEEE